MSKKDWLKVGLNLAGALIPGVAQVEAIARALPGLKGQQKADAVLELVTQSLAVAEGVTAKDLLADAEVAQAARGVITAVVAMQNLIASKHGPQTPA